jgi:2-polyprenyl-3-methyl-5-hydroxy-6-metoxy-1,4-benzoquinol methylase
MPRWKYYDAPHFHELAFLLPPQSIWRANSFGAILAELGHLHRSTHTLLDVGCGTGVLAKRIALRYPDLTVKAIDLSPHMINYAKRVHFHSSIEYRTQCFWEENGKYDCVTSTYCWYFFPLDKAARKLRSILNPKGCALIVATTGTPVTRMHRRIFRSISGQDLCSPHEITLTLKRVGFSAEWRSVSKTEGSYLVVAVLA